MKNSPIYLDYNATTPIDPQVVAAMLPFLENHFGNPSSNHSFGRAANDVVDKSRQQVAALIGANPEEIVFTGGGSEASNQAIKGVVFAHGLDKETHIITSAVEHPATVKPCEFLRTLGCKITTVPVDGTGMVDPEDVRKALQTPTALVTVMHSNNEVGTLQPIREIARLAHEHGALMHTDVAQSLGKLPVDVNDLQVDFLSVAGHKLYAPKGVGALYIRRGVKIEPLIHGAGHESGRRAGTENVPYMVALGKACELAMQSFPRVIDKLHGLRDRLWQQLQERFSGELVLNGHPELRLPNTLNVSFPGRIGAEILEKIPVVAASTGSACHEDQVTISPVLQAMKVQPNIAQGAIRLSVGRFTTEEEIDRATSAFRQAL